MSCDNCKPTGELQGDDGTMPMRGTRTGVSDAYGADIGMDSTNSIGKISRDTKSDPEEQRFSKDQKNG